MKGSYLNTGSSVCNRSCVRPGGRTGEKYGGMPFGVDCVKAVDGTRVNCIMWELPWELHREKLHRKRVNSERGGNMLHEHVYMTMHETREASLSGACGGRLRYRGFVWLVGFVVSRR